MKKTDVAKKALQLHKKLKGKIRISSASRIKNKADLSLLYTPGVGAVSSYVAQNPSEAREYTISGRVVAVISDGSAVLGLGNIGPLGALPVMEGKAAIFKEFAGVDAFPIVLCTQDPDEIVQTIKNIAPGLAGINLEDFAAPHCFYIEERLKNELSIPVIHDDQHGTAIVVLAGLINAAKVVGKKLESLSVVISGAGAAGTAIAKLLLLAGISQVIVTDSKGIISKNRTDLNNEKAELARITNPKNISGDFAHAIQGSDVVVGVSGAGAIHEEHVRSMAPNAIVFALANPIPEIMPDSAKKAGAKVVATGRSDFPNQINNALVFPGMFRGAIDKKVTKITDETKLQAAKNLAGLIKKPTADKIIPNIFDKKVVPAIARAVS